MLGSIFPTLTIHSDSASGRLVILTDGQNRVRRNLGELTMLRNLVRLAVEIRKGCQFFRLEICFKSLPWMTMTALGAEH